MRTTRRWWLKGAGSLMLAGAGVASMGAASGEGGRVVTVGGAAFGTYWRLSMLAGADRVLARKAIETIVRSVDGSMSPFRAETEISRFNAARTTDWISVTRNFQEVVAEGLSKAALTEGAFEPTVGPLVARYGFGPVRSGSLGHFAEFAVREGMIRKMRPDLTLDLCGIAKGYALDRMAAALVGLGLNAFLIELGGEVVAHGSHPAGPPWAVGIERPIPGAVEIQRVVRLEGKALATSGDLVNSFRFGGRRYSHIIDPRTNAPVDNPIASVSVIASTAVEADALATGLMVLGPEAGVGLASRHNVPALFLLSDGPDARRIRELSVAGFEAYVLA